MSVIWPPYWLTFLISLSFSVLLFILTSFIDASVCVSNSHGWLPGFRGTLNLPTHLHSLHFYVSRIIPLVHQFWWDRSNSWQINGSDIQKIRMVDAASLENKPPVDLQTCYQIPCNSCPNTNRGECTYLLPDVFDTYFIVNSSVHDHPTGSKSDILIHRVQTTYGQRYVIYKGGTLCNYCNYSLSCNLKMIQSTS